MKRCFKVDKLVRDRVPSIMDSHNIDIKARYMETEEFIVRLKDKLVEEAKEVVSTQTSQELVEELCDVWEVFRALLHVHDLSMDQIEKQCLLKKESKGAFDTRLYCESLEMDFDNPKAHYYEERPLEYPEITGESHPTILL